jgi:hypothetical protein
LGSLRLLCLLLEARRCGAGGLKISSPQSCATSVGEREENAGDRNLYEFIISYETASQNWLDTYSLQKNSRNAKGGVGGLPLFNVPLLLRTAHTLQLEVAVVGLRSDSLALKDDESNRSDDLKIVSNITSFSKTSLVYLQG